MPDYQEKLWELNTLTDQIKEIYIEGFDSIKVMNVLNNKLILDTIDLIVCDVSFISLKKVIKPILLAGVL